MIEPYITTIDISKCPTLTDNYLLGPQTAFEFNGEEYQLPKVYFYGKTFPDHFPQKFVDKHIYRRPLFHKEWQHLIEPIFYHVDKFAEMHGLGKQFTSYNWLNRYDVGEFSHLHRHVTEGDDVAAVLYFQHHPVPLLIYDDDDNTKVVAEIPCEPGKLVILSGSCWHANARPNPGPTRWALTTNFSSEKSIAEFKALESANAIYKTNEMIGRVRDSVK